MTSWNPENFSKKKENLRKRMVLIKSIRSFFDNYDFWEVETPCLQVSPGLEPHLHAFETKLISVDQQNSRDIYLHTSPEFAMKKLLVAGSSKIYQICHVFRNAEGSSRHSPEFTMIEWYRAGAGYKDIMDDVVGLLRSCASDLGLKEYRYKTMFADPFNDWEVITVVKAFQKYADINLETLLDDEKAFRTLLNDRGYHTSLDDSWNDLFFRVFLEKIEPNLGQGQPTIIYDYPVSMAALSREKEDDKRFAERFEVYVCGMELANAFGELTNAKEQRLRFEADMDLKEKLYGKSYPIDDDFMSALEYGMPESSGIALGIDRLAMLACGVEKIEDVLWLEV